MAVIASEMLLRARQSRNLLGENHDPTYKTFIRFYIFNGGSLLRKETAITCSTLAHLLSFLH
jgi:hypothetical protein